jgi:REP element-mobilizing transposase RayT
MLLLGEERRDAFFIENDPEAKMSLKGCRAVKYDAERHHRVSVRLRDYDYSQAGAYFVTICTAYMACLFGNVIGWKVELSILGEMAFEYWAEIPNHFKTIQLDEFIVMPNHIHGMLVITDSCRGVKFNAPTSKRGNYYSRISPMQNTLSVVVRTYKSAVSRWCKQNGYRDFQWQRNYYEHIIRSEKDLTKVREYIVTNPVKWDLDCENPERK